MYTEEFQSFKFSVGHGPLFDVLIVCVEVLQSSQPIRVMSSVVN